MRGDLPVLPAAGVSEPTISERLTLLVLAREAMEEQHYEGERTF